MKNFSRSLPPSSINAYASKPLAPLKSATPEVEKRSLSTMFEQLITISETRPVSAGIENALTYYLFAETTNVYMCIEAQEKLFCSSNFVSCPSNTGIVGHSFTKKEIVMAQNPTSFDDYDISCDPSHLPSIYIPLLNESGNAVGVSVSYRSTPFSDIELRKAKKFMNKFVIYSTFLIQRLKAPIMPNCSLEQIRNHLNARDTDLFLYRQKEFFKLNHQSGDFINVRNVGSAKYSLINKLPAIYDNVRDSENFNAHIDGDVDEPIIFEPCSVGQDTYCLAIRGKLNSSRFTTADVAKVEAIAPLFAQQYSEETPQDIDDGTHESFAVRLKALLEVAESLSGVLDIDKLVPIIMDRACQLLHTERCSLFTVDVMRKQLVSRYNGGLSNAIRMPMTKGIVGHTACTGQVVNITDAYADSRFDQSVDKQTGFKTKTLLTVPIMNNRGEIAGVTEMINRVDGKAFDDDDIRMMVAFNVFCGISLDNANLYATSIELTSHLRSFIDTSTAITGTKKLNVVVKEILENAKALVIANYASVYLYDVEKDELSEFSTIGEGEGDIALMNRALKNRQPITEQSGQQPSDEVVPVSSRTSASRISFAFLQQSALTEADEANKSKGSMTQMVFPLMTNDGRILGVMQLNTDKKVMVEDFKLIDCFAVFIAVSLERNELQEIADLGHTEAQLNKWVAENERGVCPIPEKLQIEAGRTESIFKITFDAPRWDGIGHFRVLFHIFDSFGLLKKFNVPNERFFRFLFEVSSSYNKVPYHNWRHAVDVTQFVTYQVRLSKLDEVLTPFELFGLLVAAICHDVNHDGFTNVFNEKAETPLGILFKNQSVMETHHCQVAIGIISKEECNIFSCFDSTEYKNMWTLIIALILTTDMAKHHKTLETANKRLDEGPLDFSKAEERQMAMELVLKCADISNVSRPFELADKWCDVLCEEFFRQGDLEKTSGMEYTSPLNDRAHLDKPKSQIGFYTFVCLPLFETAARAIPALDANVQQIKSNLEEWKSRIK